MTNNTSKTELSSVVENPLSTVVAKYISDVKRADHYESEDALEKAFIKQLETQAYEYLKITGDEDLRKNLRKNLEKLNDIKFSETEWEYFFTHEIANTNQGISDKTRTIQEDHIKILKRDDGTSKNIYLIDKKSVHNNAVQVINQYATDDGKRSNRYDVTILVNGLPMVHVELKRRGVAIEEAFNQINRYQRESFWANSGLFEYVQLFVISNGTHTKYYSNTTRFAHLKESGKNKFKKGKKTSSSFEFTSWWADATNRPIMDLMDFAKTFFAKNSLLNVITKYCIFTSDELMLVMRPYQIVATESIINKIESSTNYKTTGTIDAGGYVWHTTGSGKTLTSFKSAQLASKIESVDKVLFVVDRKDLDYQTMKEYDKFEKGSANSNTSTAKLTKQLEDPNARIIITTIQKLDRFIKKNKGHEIFGGHIVLIFDECHRSQFGDMHDGITKSFKKYNLFGFTGTPIFAKNSSAGGRADLKTTEQAFGKKLHTYTIVDAIADKNVLKFKVDYVSTMKEEENIADKDVQNIDREKALLSPKRISNIVGYIREHFDQKTRRNSHYKLNDRRLAGFNSIFAVSSIKAAKHYYLEFQKQLENVPSDKKLKVATIFSFGVNEGEGDGLNDENPENIDGLDKNSRDFLESAIIDYNKMFGTSYDTSSEKFQNYYKDLSQRVKNREVDVLIVVNMFLTGFDATTMNTLWVDKNLRMHGLLQAFSRTNRILNSVKTHGNIVCFRNLEKATNESIALFGDREAAGIVLLKSFNEYYNGYENDGKKVRGYSEIIAELQENFPLGERIISEESQKEFIKLYGGVLRMRNILNVFDEFAGLGILTDRNLQDYHSMYIDLYKQFRKENETEEENINDDLVFEMELIKQVEINIDFVIELIKKYHSTNKDDKEILGDIDRAIASSEELRNKKDLIHGFIASLEMESVVDNDWHTFVDKQKLKELDSIIQNEKLDKNLAYKFIQNSFRDGELETNGTVFAEILPPISIFSPNGELHKKRKSVIGKLTDFFNRFFDIAGREFSEEK